MKKIRPVKNTSDDCLINCISEPIRKVQCGSKDNGRGKKLSKQNQFFYIKREQIKNKIFRDIRTLFETEEENEGRKRQRN